MCSKKYNIVVLNRKVEVIVQLHTDECLQYCAIYKKEICGITHPQISKLNVGKVRNWDNSFHREVRLRH